MGSKSFLMDIFFNLAARNLFFLPRKPFFLLEPLPDLLCSPLQCNVIDENDLVGNLRQSVDRYCQGTLNCISGLEDSRNSVETDRFRITLRTDQQEVDLVNDRGYSLDFRQRACWTTTTDRRKTISKLIWTSETNSWQTTKEEERRLRQTTTYLLLTLCNWSIGLDIDCNCKVIFFKKMWRENHSFCA